MVFVSQLPSVGVGHCGYVYSVGPAASHEPCFDVAAVGVAVCFYAVDGFVYVVIAGELINGLDVGTGDGILETVDTSFDVVCTGDTGQNCNANLFQTGILVQVDHVFAAGVTGLVVFGADVVLTHGVGGVNVVANNLDACFDSCIDGSHQSVAGGAGDSNAIYVAASDQVEHDVILLFCNSLHGRLPLSLDAQSFCGFLHALFGIEENNVAQLLADHCNGDVFFSHCGDHGQSHNQCEDHNENLLHGVIPPFFFN